MIPNKTISGSYIVDLINNKQLYMDEELQIFVAIFQKYNFKSISEYAKLHKKTYKGIEYQIEKGLVQNIEVNGNIFVFD